MPDYIPSSDKGFNDFQDDLLKGVEPNIALWGIPQLSLDTLKVFQAAWASAWARAKNKDTRTRKDVVDKNKARNAYESAIRKFVNQWLSYNTQITDGERKALGLTVADTIPTPAPKIETRPDVRLEALGGGLMKFTCRVEKDSTRPSMHPDADAIEIKYKIGGETPASPAECPENHNSSRSNFTIKLNVQDAGKRFFSFARWKNNSDDSKSGPWTRLYSAVIND